MQQSATSHNQKILSNPDSGNVFQSVEFAHMKESQGWTAKYESLNGLSITILEKNVIGLGKLWYTPKGPGVESTREIETLLPELKSLASNNGVFAVKIEPELLRTDENLAALLNLDLKKVRPIQPNFSTVLIDLSTDLETVLSNLNQKGRHAIRRAERDGVIVERVSASDENCKIMYELLAETASGSFGIRSYDYYKDFWQSFKRANMGQMFFAYVEGKIVAGAFALVFGNKSTYKDGASTRQRTVYGASHLLQWEVIKWAHENGSKLHDLCGAPPSDQIKNPDHPHYGIGQFKTSFNKTVTDYVGAYDFVIKPLSYKVWTKIGERLALRLHHTRHHESYY